ncbi:hypothetical protein TrCOL_g5193 [Triparma columacea]|uniref:SAP domain-containing protein n=1 Tax=Triparma columacea TaxID=722753 RepID=A0A9W7GSM0_9STRA|nr:hypothetical protein TrCOL_g5193 [Triparma columacea]
MKLSQTIFLLVTPLTSAFIPSITSPPPFLPFLPSTSLQSTSASSSQSTSARDELSQHTVPVLKDMLRERGEKVGGRKSELVERLLKFSIVSVDAAVTEPSDEASTVAASTVEASPVDASPVAVEASPVAVEASPVDDDDDPSDSTDVPYVEIPTLSPLSIKTLRKSASRLRSRRTLPLTSFSSSPTSIDSSALGSLDVLLGENELVEAKAILMGGGPIEVKDAVFQIAATLQVAVVERKGYSAVFYRPSTSGKGIRIYESNNADGMQFEKKIKVKRDKRGRPVKE